MPADSTEINFLLDQYRDGQTEGFEKLMELVYDDLRKLAAWQLQSERPDHTLQPTALVHEVYLKLSAQNPIEWQNKVHFFALAAQVMRHILVDYARTRQREKRGGGQTKVGLEDVLTICSSSNPELIALDEALERGLGVREALHPIERGAELEPDRVVGRRELDEVEA